MNGRRAASLEAAIETATHAGDATAADIAIRLERVVKTCGSGEVAVHALRGIDLEIEAGQFVVVLGPSGSGKTTLMNLIGGIESPTSGRIMVAGRDLTTLDDRALTAYRRAEVGFVFQFFNLVPTLTAADRVPPHVDRSPSKPRATRAAGQTRLECETQNTPVRSEAESARVRIRSPSRVHLTRLPRST